MRRCGVHAGGCGGPLSPPGSETGNPTSWQEGDADLTEKLKSTSHNDRARSTRENGKRGGLSGFWELHVHKPRSPGRLSPHPAGAGTAGLQPRSYGWVPRPNRSPSGLGGLVRRSPLSAATPTPPRRPRLYPPSPCTSHASQTRPGDRKEHGTQGGTGRGAENSRTEDGTERGPRTPAPGGPAIAPGGGSRLTRLGETTRLRVQRPPTPAPPGFCPPPSPDGRACTEKPPFQPGHAREPKVVFFALFC